MVIAELLYLFILFLFSGGIIHELGHVLTARLLGIKIIKIEIHFLSKSFTEIDKIDDTTINKLVGFSGGFFSSIFLLIILLIFPFTSIIPISSFKLSLTDIGLFFCLTLFIGGIIEGIFHEFYMNNKFSQIYITILSLVVYYILYHFF
jgi:hypothetical protein